ncbi:hypothetical protein DFJ73DRAFT_805990, partial [Zopfochytrium polystomum]
MGVNFIIPVLHFLPPWPAGVFFTLPSPTKKCSHVKDFLDPIVAPFTMYIFHTTTSSRPNKTHRVRTHRAGYWCNDFFPFLFEVFLISSFNNCWWALYLVIMSI